VIYSFILLIIYLNFKSTLAHVSFTNLKCESHDKKFAQFETCHIKAVNRTHKYIDIYAKLKVVPVSKVEAILSHVTFTNLKCGTSDKGFFDFEKCYIKAVNRSHKYIDIYVSLKKVPMDNVTINVKLMRYNNGYKPFFVDVTYDACKFLKNPNKNPIVKMLYYAYVNSSNLNHTCPYNHNVILEKLWTGNLEKDFGHYVPLPNGDYAIYTEWTIDGALRASIKVYMKLN
ncbi:hypothetical protein KR200_007000, partial [Drosophila serrata]